MCSHTVYLFLLDAEGLGSLEICVPRGERSEGAFHVGINQREAVDVAGVDPAETALQVSRLISEALSFVSTYPSRGTPLKSAPWLPYSASTLCGSMALVTSYFSTTTPLKSENALVTMYSQR